MNLPKPYYQDSAVTLYHGDCRQIVPLLGRFDLLLTDPPYGLGDKWQGGKAKWPLHHGQMHWDASTVPELITMVEKCSSSVIWGGHLYPLPVSRGWLIWDKLVRNFTSGHCELAWSNLDQPVRAFNFSHGELASEGKLHPTQKPLPLITWCLSFTPEAKTILDPFAGSGTTGRACKDLGKHCTMIEREESYCEIIARRMGQEVLAL